MADYNGWTNWETWQINLWFGGDEELYRCQRDFIDCAARQDDKITGTVVRDFVYEMLPEGTPDMERGWLTDEPVNWDEIAEHWEDERQEMLEDES
jgi:hypothetical protein